MAETIIADKIFELLGMRREGATICPSDVARALSSEEDQWRALMPEIRQVAHRLAEKNLLAVTRGGVTVNATSPGGPIRLGRPRKHGGSQVEPSHFRRS